MTVSFCRYSVHNFSLSTIFILRRDQSKLSQCLLYLLFPGASAPVAAFLNNVYWLLESSVSTVSKLHYGLCYSFSIFSLSNTFIATGHFSAFHTVVPSRWCLPTAEAPLHYEVAPQKLTIGHVKFLPRIYLLRAKNFLKPGFSFCIVCIYTEHKFLRIFLFFIPIVSNRNIARNRWQHIGLVYVSIDRPKHLPAFSIFPIL